MEEAVWDELKSIFHDVILDTNKRKQDGHLFTINQFLTQHNQEPIEIDLTPQSNARSSLYETLSSLKNTINTEVEMPVNFNTSNFADISSLDQAENVLLSLEKVINTHQKHTLLFSERAGFYLYRCKLLCGHRNYRFVKFVHELNVKWSLSHVYFLIKLYKFLETYPKFKYVNTSLYFFKVNLVKIREYLEMYDDEANFWKIIN